jgi:hypothetical protein
MRIAITALSAILLAGAANAEVMTVEPGKWKTTGNMQMVVNVAGQKNTMPIPLPASEECLTEDKNYFDPDDFSDDTCRIANVQQTSTSMKFDVECDQQGMTLNGAYSMTKSSDGKSVKGTVNMVGGQMGMNITMDGNISAQHIGACS